MKVSIERINAPSLWFEPGETATLQIEAIKGFTTSDGQFVPPSNGNQLYLEIPISIANNVPLIESIEIDSTEDAYPWDAETTGDVPGYRATIVTSRRKRIPYLPQFRVPTIKPGDPSLTWGEIRVFNRAFVPRYTALDRQISVTQVQEWIQNAVGALNRASDTNTGVTALSAAPIDPTFPEAVGANDPLWLQLLAGTFGIGGDVGNVDNRVPVSDGSGGRTLKPSLLTVTPNGDVGIGTNDPVFNDDGTTGALVGRWLAVDGSQEGVNYSGYFGVGGNVSDVNARVGAVNFFNYAMGGADHRTASIISFNDAQLGRGNLVISTSPNNVGPIPRMYISYNGDVSINHLPSLGTRFQVEGATSGPDSYSMVLYRAGDTPFFFARNDGKVFIATIDPNSAVSPASDGVLLVGTSGEFSVKANGDVLQRSLQFTGGVRPAADASNRGKIWLVPGGPGVADTIEICRKNAADAYEWVSLV